MLWERNRELATALRNQGLADCLTARFALRQVDLKLFDEPVTFAHVVVLKSQQSVEKLTKGYRLWHSSSFDPTRGHSPFTGWMHDEPRERNQVLGRLIQTLNIVNRFIVREIMWLENLAPKPPVVDPEQRGSLQRLEIIEENTEYPYWSDARRSLITPAQGITLFDHGVRAFKTLRTYLTVLSRSDPPDYCTPIADFLNFHTLSTEISDWPLRPG